MQGRLCVHCVMHDRKGVSTSLKVIYVHLEWLYTPYTANKSWLLNHGYSTIKFDWSLLRSEVAMNGRGHDLKHTHSLQKTSFGCQLLGVYITLSDGVPRLISITQMITFMHVHTLYCKYNIADTIEFQMKLQSHGDSTIKFSWYFIWSFVLVRSGVAVKGGGRVYSRWMTSFECWLLGFYIQFNCNESMLNRK